MSIDAQIFAQAGEAMFGEEWKSPVADLLGMDVRTVRRIAKAAREGTDYPVNPSLGPVLAQHLTAFIAEMGPRLASAQSVIDRLNDGRRGSDLVAATKYCVEPMPLKPNGDGGAA